MVSKGFWHEAITGTVTHEQKILEQLLHMGLEALEWLTEINGYDPNDESSEDKTMYELADVLIVLMDLCGGIGIDVDLNAIHSSLSLKQDCDALKAIKSFLDGTRKRGTFEQADVEKLVQTVYCMYGKAVVLAYVEEKMEKNIQRPPKYGKQPFTMKLKYANHP